MNYKSPGNADTLPPAIVQAWNAEIQRQYNQLQKYESKFFKLDPAQINGSDVPVAWFGDPAEPAFCFDEDVARNLSDWGLKGRHELHNEYCEYHVTYAVDHNGKSRPKRVEFTTELREYWTTLAIADPGFTQKLVKDVLGFTPTFQDLYGVDDPSILNSKQRKIAFSRKVSGNGLDPELQEAGVPSQPEGPINREHALFMTHPINGLDDLLYIVMFGAKPYAQQTATGREPASKEQIFRSSDVEHLACRHADPRAATGAHDLVYQGKTIGFSDPIGVYIHSFTTDDLRYKNNAIPDTWKIQSRGNQRLVFGPSDDEPAYLDEVIILQGADERSLSGGYDLAKRIEVGPNIRISEKSSIQDADFVFLADSNDPIVCGEAEVCKRIAQLKAEYDSQGHLAVVAPRRIGIVA
jgi:hypothetical protein